MYMYFGDLGEYEATDGKRYEEREEETRDCRTNVSGWSIFYLLIIDAKISFSILFCIGE